MNGKSLEQSRSVNLVIFQKQPRCFHFADANLKGTITASGFRSKNPFAEESRGIIALSFGQSELI